MTPTISALTTRRADRFAAAHLPMLLLTVAVVAGMVARFGILLPRDFPIVDGGMFYAMINDLRAAHYTLPAFTSYNHLPYAYSPRAFYFTALLSDLTGVSPLVYVWALPTVFNLLTILVVYLLGAALLDSELKGALAALMYAVNPIGYEWFIMGGGLTRAPGYLFALLRIYCAYQMYTRGRRRYVMLADVVAPAVRVLWRRIRQSSPINVNASRACLPTRLLTAID